MRTTTLNHKSLNLTLIAGAFALALMAPCTPRCWVAVALSAALAVG